MSDRCVLKNAGRYNESQPVHTFSATSPFQNLILRNPNSGDGTNSQRNRKLGSFVLEELNRFHIKMVVVIMGNQNPIVSEVPPAG